MVLLCLLAIDHPRCPEFVGQHAEFLGPKGLTECHAYGSLVGERVEDALGLLRTLEAEIDREALHGLIALGRGVRSHQHHAIPDETRVEDLLEPLSWNMAFGWCALMRDHGDDGAAEDALIGLESLFELAVEGEVRIDLHAALLGDV